MHFGLSPIRAKLRIRPVSINGSSHMLTSRIWSLTSMVALLAGPMASVGHAEQAAAPPASSLLPAPALPAQKDARAEPEATAGAPQAIEGNVLPGEIMVAPVKRVAPKTPPLPSVEGGKGAGKAGAKEPGKAETKPEKPAGKAARHSDGGKHKEPHAGARKASSD